MEEVLNLVDKFSFQILLIQISLILVIFAVFIWIWLYNKRKYNHLKHQIPATVVKNYLDSIIQNSTALKSSLFRGGGLDVDPNSVPSVMSFKDLAQGASSIALSSGSESEELNSKNAEIMRLRSELEVKNNVVRDLEKELTGLTGEVKARDERIIELEKMLENLKNATPAGESSEVSESVLSELDDAKKERDELKNRLAEYAIIEDDLANLKRLQQENEQLKRSLANSGGESNSSEDFNDDEVSSEMSSNDDEETDLGIDEDELQAMEDALDSPDESASEDSQEEEVVEASAEVESTDEEGEKAEETSRDEETVQASSSEESEDSSEEVEEKSPEDLLSEFEKMLG